MCSVLKRFGARNSASNRCLHGTRRPSVLILTRSYVRTTQFTKQDAGYTATDYVLSLMLKRRACRWISATNADNVYGSQVVQNVLHAPPDPITRKVADMLLNPIDSRNFMWVGK
jgi:hypothetical protein